LVGVVNDWPDQRRQWLKEEINSAMVDEPVARDGSVLTTGVIHAKVWQRWRDHPGLGNVVEREKEVKE